MNPSRVPPHNLEAERAVLGAVLLRGGAAPAEDISPGIDPKDFHHPANGLVYQAILELYQRMQPIDTLTVANELRAREQLRRIDGGEAYVAALLDDVPTAHYVVHYARIVRELASLRRLIVACTEIAGQAYGDAGDVSDFLDEAERKIYEIAQRSHSEGYAKVASLLKEAIRAIEKRREKGSDITGVPTGYADLDKLTSGLQPGDLVIIAARPSMGKTSFALNIAQNAAVFAGV